MVQGGEEEWRRKRRKILGEGTLFVTPTNQATGEYKAICPFEKKRQRFAIRSPTGASIMLTFAGGVPVHGGFRNKILTLVKLTPK